MTTARSLRALTLACVLAGCTETHVIDISDPSARQLGAALDQLDTLLPKVKTGRWEIATSSPTVTLEGLDRDDADRLRALGRALNTASYCRKEPDAIDTRAAIAIEVNRRPGCTITRLTADPDRLAYAVQCSIEDTVMEETTEISFTGDRFVTLRTNATGYNGSQPGDARKLRYDGRHVGTCSGDEGAGPALWNDPR